MAVFGPRGPEHAHQLYTPQHLQDLQRQEDKTNEVIMVLEANVDVMRSMCKFYNGLRSNRDIDQALKDKLALDISTFTAQIDDMISDFKMQISRANLLVKITKDRKELVSLSSQDSGKLITACGFVLTLRRSHNISKARRLKEWRN